MNSPEAKDMLTSIGSQLPGIMSGVLVVAALIGFVYSLRALFLWHRTSRPGTGGAPAGAIIFGLISGSLLTSLNASANVYLASMFGNSSPDPRYILDYAPPTSSDYDIAMHVILLIVNLIGWLGIIKGLSIWRNGSLYNEPYYFSKGLVYQIAGSALTVVVAVADAVSVTAGFDPLGSQYLSF